MAWSSTPHSSQLSSSSVVILNTNPTTEMIGLGGTYNNVAGNQVNNTNLYFVQGTSSGLSRASPPTPFIHAPLDILSVHFTGRTDELLQIKEMLDSLDDDVPIRCVIHGMHGIGKSQLTLFFAKTAFDEGLYRYVFWVSATTVEKFQLGLVKLLDLIDHKDRYHPEQEIRLMTAKRWLEECKSRWLLVLDNVESDTLDVLRNYLPQRNKQGNILLTTRSEYLADTLAHAAGKRHHVLELRIPNIEDATKILLAHIEGDVDNERTRKAEDVVKCVGRLPLAISQARSFMKQSGKSLDYMLDLYHSSRKIEMINWENALSNYEVKSVAATFLSQLEDLSRQHPTASNLLSAIAFLDPETVSLDMITQGAKVAKPSFLRRVKQRLSNSRRVNFKPLVAVIQSPVEFQKAITQLQNRSLVKHHRDSENPTLSMHNLVHFMVQWHVKSSGTEYHWFEFAARLVSGAFADVEDPTLPQYWTQCEMCISHVRSLTEHEEAYSRSGAWNAVVNINFQIARYLYSRGRYGESEKLLQRVQAWQERIHGRQHAKTLRTTHCRAFVYRLQGRYQEAEALFRRVLAVQEKVLGNHHFDTLITRSNLAASHELQGRYKEAEELHKEVLAIREKRLGTGHPRTLITMNSLAIVYTSQGRYVDAELMHRRVLTSRQRILGAEHPHTLLTMDQLAIVYAAQGRYADAESVHKEVFAIREKLYGPEHPDTLITKNNLAAVYQSQGRYPDAEKLQRQVLDSRKKLFGNEHLFTITTMTDLANTYAAQGRHDEAEKMHKEALVLREKIVGVEHPSTF